MPQAGYDTTFINNLVGGPDIASVSSNAVVLSDSLDWLADDNEFTVGLVPSPPSVPAVHAAAGKAPGALVPRGVSQANAAGLLGLGLPNVVVYAGGVALVLGLGYLVFKRKRAA
jgi:hypothetical protein